MKRTLNAFSLVVCSTVVFSTGCAVGNKYNYSNVVADISSSGTAAISVSVHDQRVYVKSGGKSPTFVGFQRGGWGNPFDAFTASGRPLADDMTGVIADSLSKKGFKAVPVAVSSSDSRDAVLDKMKAAKADRMILLTLNEWKSDTYQNVALIYDVSLTAYDRDGKVLAEKKSQGRDNLGGSAWNPPAHARRAVPGALKNKIEELLNSPDIAKTLQ